MTIATPAKWFQDGFHRFLGSYLKRHFHALAVDRESSPASQIAEITQRTGLASPLVDLDVPMIVYSNHPSWWDPLLAHYINRQLLFPRQFYAPIDAAALARYRVFEKLGFFGVDPHSARGAATFLKVAAELFRRPGSVLWMTPEGRFADPRDVAAELMPGLPHLCHRLTRGWVFPVAMELVFWEERLPECLFHFGDVIVVDEQSLADKATWKTLLTQRLREAQTQLATQSIARRSEPFDNLLRGKGGASGWYDVARRVKATVTGQPFRAAHGEKFE